MRGDERISLRGGGVLRLVYRCTCGSWRYEGNHCRICAAIMRGREHELGNSRTTD